MWQCPEWTLMCKNAWSHTREQHSEMFINKKYFSPFVYKQWLYTKILCKGTQLYPNPKIFTLLTFARFIFAVIYYLQFQAAVNIRCSKNSFKLNFRVFNFCGFFQPRIINNCENFQNYVIWKFSVRISYMDQTTTGLTQLNHCAQ